MFYRHLFAALILVVAAFSSVPAPLQAATEPLAMCPLSNAISVGFPNPTTNRTSEARFSDNVVLVNTSDYIVQGMQLALAWYSEAGVPTHAVILVDDVALDAKEETVYSFSVDVSALPTGVYDVRPFLVAGDEIAVLGHIMNSRAVPAVTFIKQTTDNPSFAVATVINNGSDVPVEPGSALAVAVKTTNLQSTPLLDGRVAVAIAQGTTPLGEAVKTSVVDSLKLFPGSSRNTTLLDPFLQSGVYSVTSFIIVPGVAQAITATPIFVGDSNDTYSFSYLSALGFSVEESANVTAIACIAETTPGAPRSGEVLELTTADFSQTADSLPRDTTAVSFELPRITSEAAVTLALLAPRERATAANKIEAEALTGDGLVPVQTISFMPECERFKLCVEDLAKATESFVQEPAFKTSLWFYLGIMLAALLLQLIIVRRLPLQKEKTVEMTKPKM